MDFLRAAVVVAVFCSPSALSSLVAAEGEAGISPSRSSAVDFRTTPGSPRGEDWTVSPYRKSAAAPAPLPSSSTRSTSAPKSGESDHLGILSPHPLVINLSGRAPGQTKAAALERAEKNSASLFPHSAMASPFSTATSLGGDVPASTPKASTLSSPAPRTSAVSVTPSSAYSVMGSSPILNSSAVKPTSTASQRPPARSLLLQPTGSAPRTAPAPASPAVQPSPTRETPNEKWDQHFDERRRNF